MKQKKIPVMLYKNRIPAMLKKILGFLLLINLSTYLYASPQVITTINLKQQDASLMNPLPIAVNILDGKVFVAGIGSKNVIKFNPITKSVDGEIKGISSAYNLFCVNNKLYLTGYNSNGRYGIHIYNTDTLQILETIPSLNGWIFSIRIDGETLYYGTWGKLYSVNLNDKTQKLLIDFGSWDNAVSCINVDSVRNRLYITVYKYYAAIARVVNFNLSTKEIVANIPIGENPFPWDVRYDAAYDGNSKLFITQMYHSEITVVDIINNSVIANIPNISWPQKLTIDRAKKRLYVVDNYTDKFHIIDTENLQLVKQFSPGDDPSGICIDLERSRIYTANYWSHDIGIIDSVTETLVERIPFVANSPLDISITEDKLYVSNGQSGGILVVDKNSHLLIDKILPYTYREIGGMFLYPSGLMNIFTGEIRTDTQYAYTVDKFNNAVAVFDILEGKFVEHIATTGQATSITKDENKLYIPHTDSNKLYLSVVLNGAITDNIPLSDNGLSYGLEVNKKTNKVYIADYNNNKIVVVNLAFKTVKTQISVADFPAQVAIDENSNLIYVTNYGADCISVIDGETDTLLGYILTGASPWGIDVNPLSKRIYVVNTNDKTLTIIDGRDNTIVATLPIGSGAKYVKTDIDAQRVYIPNQLDQSITVVEDWVDIVPPDITHLPVENGQYDNASILISAEVRDNVGVSKATLNYREPGKEFITVKLSSSTFANTKEISAGIGGGIWGNGYSIKGDPYNSWYHDRRAQTVYLASELSSQGLVAGNITAMQLHCYEQPGRDLADFRIRMQHTDATTSTGWVTGGWTLTYGPTTISKTDLIADGWYTYTLHTPFYWDGKSNLLIDISVDDIAYTSGGGMYVRTGLNSRTYAGYSDSYFTWPFDTMWGTIYDHIPEMRIIGAVSSTEQDVYREYIYSSFLQNLRTKTVEYYIDAIDEQGNHPPTGQTPGTENNPNKFTVNDITPPKSVRYLEAETIEGKVLLTFQPSISGDAAIYKIYSVNGTGTIDYTTPIAMLIHPAYEWVSNTLSYGLYKFSIRTTDISGIEEKNTTIVLIEHRPLAGTSVNNILQNSWSYQFGQVCGGFYRMIPGPSAAIGDIREDISGLEIATGNEEFYPLGSSSVRGRWFLFNKTGNVIWWKNTEDDEAHSSTNIYDVDNDGTIDIVGGTTSGHELQCMDAYSSFNWRYFVGRHVISTPAIWHKKDLNVKVGFGSFDGYIRCLDGPTGSLLWKYPTGSWIWSSAAVGDLDNTGKIDLIIGSDDTYIYCINTETGQLKWRYKTNGWVRSSAALIDINNDKKKEVIIGSSDGKLYCLNGTTGELIWSVTTGGYVISSPAVGDIDSDGILDVIFGSADGKLYCVNSVDGSIKWSLNLQSPIFSSPALAGRDKNSTQLSIYVTSYFGYLYVIDSSGNIIDQFAAAYNVVSSPVVGDVDGDGKLEIFFQDRFADINNNTGDYFWSTKDVGSNVEPYAIEWGRFRRDKEHTGVYQKIDSAPPEVSISISPAEVTWGEEFTVTVTGTDDKDLTAIWWWGVDTPDDELNKAHWYSCSGTEVTYTWTVSSSNLPPGTYTLGANARDKAYPTPGEAHQASEGAGIAYVNIVVLESGFQGVAYERNPDGSIGSRIPGVNITFTSEDGKITKSITTDNNGFYRIQLLPVRYVVTAICPGYEDYSSSPGFFVCTGNGYQTGNFFLIKEKDMLPPEVYISIEPEEVEKKGEIKVTVTGTDDKDLAAIWWWGENTQDTEIDKAHWYSCSGTSVTYTWTVSISNLSPGTYKLGANARDAAYPVEGEPHQASEGEGIAYAEFRVVEPEPVDGVANAIIKVPKDGKRIRGNAVTVMAEATENTTAVLFQYRSVDADWTNITSLDEKFPYAVYWNVSALPNGEYQLRAVAYDENNLPDIDPSFITVYIDDVNADIVEDGNPYVDPNKPHRKEEKISSKENNEVILADGTKAVFPAGSFSGVKRLVIKIITSSELSGKLPPPESSLKPVGIFREYTFTDGTVQFYKNITLTIPYPDEDEDGIVDGTNIREQDLQIYYLNERNNRWEPVEKVQHQTKSPIYFTSSFPIAGNYLKANVDHFTIFGLFTIIATEDLSNLIVYPNPYIPNDSDPATGTPQDKIKFDGLTQQANVRIFTISGRLIREIKSDNTDGFIEWDTKNNDDELVTSGVYIYLVTNNNGHKKSGKLAIIR